MKKYNLSKIMKIAWVLVKRFKETISSALKKAWREAKMIALRGSEKQVAWANDIRNKGLEICEEYDFSFAKEKFQSEDSAKWFIDGWRGLTRKGYKFDMIANLMELNIQEETRIIREKTGKAIGHKEQMQILNSYSEKYRDIDSEVDYKLDKLWMDSQYLWGRSISGQ